MARAESSRHCRHCFASQGEERGREGDRERAGQVPFLGVLGGDITFFEDSGVGVGLSSRGRGISRGACNTVCEVCGDIGYKNLLLCCEDCKSSAAHQYCLNEVVFDAKLVEWLCHECLQRRSEVSCSRSLEKVLSERQPSHTHFGSILHQPITNTVESARDAGPWRNRKRKSCMTEYAHGDSTSKVIDGLTRERENVRFQLKASNGMEQSRMAANVPPPSTLQNGAADKVMPFSPDYGCKKMYSCGGIKNIPHAREENVDSVYVSSSSEHDTTESSESSERLAECQKVSSCHHGGTVRMGAASLSYEESGEDIFSESESLESRDVQAPPRPDYVLSCGRYLSKAQKMRVVKFIQETQPEFTVFVAVMRKGNVQPPGPFLAISKGYAFAHFPHESTHVTLQRPGMSKEWHPKFYKRDEYRKYFLMGQWLDFVNDNNVQEGDICLILPSKGGRRCIFTVYLLRTTSSHSRGGANFQRDGPCPGGSSAKIAPEVHINEEPTDEEHVYVESHMREISHKSLDDEDTGGPQPPYIVSCRNDLSKSQKKIVEERVRAIQSKVPIYVAILKNNNIGMAQKWMLELGSRYASVHLPARGKTVVLQCRRKTWEAKMVIHNGRRWFLNGGWPKFARDNGLRVGDLCLFELKKNKGSNLTMTVHIISREQFEGL
ncbi:hypothetical protein ACP70R_008216 [Stipagrostis hirtigluma subsp. patula]